MKKTFAITSAEPLNLNLPLVPPKGILNIISSPPGASILLDNIATGRVTPTTLDRLPMNTTLKITLKKPNFKDYDQTIKLKSEEPESISVNLFSETGSLSLSSEPTGASIELNGKDLGQKTPYTITNLEVGNKYDVTLKLEGYTDVTKSYSIENTSLLSTTEKLNKRPPTAEQKNSIYQTYL